MQPNVYTLTEHYTKLYRSNDSSYIIHESDKYIIQYKYLCFARKLISLTKQNKCSACILVNCESTERFIGTFF